MTQLAADCALLEELRVMDYSLLLGIHSRSTGWLSSPHATDKVHASMTPCFAPLSGLSMDWRVSCKLKVSGV